MSYFYPDFSKIGNKGNDHSSESQQVQSHDKRTVVVAFTRYGHGIHTGHVTRIFTYTLPFGLPFL